MARHARDHRLETPAARKKLPVAKKPIWLSIGRGLRLGFRANQGPGTWSVAIADGRGGYNIKKIGTADDIEDADGREVLSFYQAQDKARSVGRSRGRGANSDGKLETVAEAVATYKADLKTRAADEHNATRVAHHLKGDALAGVTVAFLTSRELTLWRERLLTKVKPDSANRTMHALKATLALAARRDERIDANSVKAWNAALASVPDAAQARRAILPDAKIRAVVAAAYELDEEVGLFFDVGATTGARPSQIWRLIVANLQDDRGDPRLLMPSSKKGRGKKKFTHRPVPITPALAQRLRRAIVSRLAAPDQPLLMKTSRAWGRRNDHQEPWQHAARTAGIEPGVTAYALRHSSICRQLLAGTPTAIVARVHDTSEAMIAKNYAAYILDHADGLTRRTLIDVTPAAVTGEVIPLASRA